MLWMAVLAIQRMCPTRVHEKMAKVYEGYLLYRKTGSIGHIRLGNSQRQLPTLLPCEKKKFQHPDIKRPWSVVSDTDYGNMPFVVWAQVTKGKPTPGHVASSQQPPPQQWPAPPPLTQQILIQPQIYHQQNWVNSWAHWQHQQERVQIAWQPPHTWPPAHACQTADAWQPEDTWWQRSSSSTHDRSRGTGNQRQAPSAASGSSDWDVCSVKTKGHYEA